MWQHTSSAPVMCTVWRRELDSRLHTVRVGELQRIRDNAVKVQSKYLVQVTVQNYKKTAPSKIQNKRLHNKSNVGVFQPDY
jgi:hypothetical protein